MPFSPDSLFHNPTVAELARAHRLHYFDLTEDVAVTGRVKVISEGPSGHSFPNAVWHLGLSVSSPTI